MSLGADQMAAAPNSSQPRKRAVLKPGSPTWNPYLFVTTYPPYFRQWFQKARIAISQKSPQFGCKVDLKKLFDYNRSQEALVCQGRDEIVCYVASACLSAGGDALIRLVWFMTSFMPAGVPCSRYIVHMCFHFHCRIVFRGSSPKLWSYVWRTGFGLERAKQLTRCDECGTEFSVLKMQLYKDTDKESICFFIWKNLGPIEEVAPVDLRLFDKSRVADFPHDVGDMDVWDLRPRTKP